MFYDDKQRPKYIKCPSCEMRSTRYGNVVRDIRRLHGGGGKPVRLTTGKQGGGDPYLSRVIGNKGAAVRPWDSLRCDLLSIRRRDPPSSENYEKHGTRPIVSPQMEQLNVKPGKPGQIIFGYICIDCEKCLVTEGIPVYFNNTSGPGIKNLLTNHVCEESEVRRIKHSTQHAISSILREAKRSHESGESLKNIITGTYPFACLWAGHDLYLYAESVGYDFQTSDELSLYTSFDQFGLGRSLHSKYTTQEPIWYTYKVVIDRIERCRNL
jgi:hypothetical protein